MQFVGLPGLVSYAFDSREYLSCLFWFIYVELVPYNFTAETYHCCGCAHGHTVYDIASNVSDMGMVNEPRHAL